MIYNNLLKLKDELKDKPEEKPKLDRVMSILMRRYDYGVDDMEEYRYGDFRDEIAAVIRRECGPRNSDSSIFYNALDYRRDVMKR